MNQSDKILLGAAFIGHLNGAKYALHHNANCNFKDALGRTILMYACIHNHFEVVKLLLEQPNIDINAKDANGKTALTLARHFGNKDIVNLLKKHGATE